MSVPRVTSVSIPSTFPRFRFSYPERLTPLHIFDDDGVERTISLTEDEAENLLRSLANELGFGLVAD